MDENRFKHLDHNDPMVERILDAAEKCVSRYGIRRTSVGEVARVGKLSRGSIYRHFPDKDALISAVFFRLRTFHLNRMEAILESETTLADKVTQAVVLGRDNLKQGLIASLAEIEPETIATMFMDNSLYDRSVEFWPPHIIMAKESGEIGQQVDVAIATDFIMRLAVSLVAHPDMGVSLKSKAEIREYIECLVIKGLSS